MSHLNQKKQSKIMELFNLSGIAKVARAIAFVKDLVDKGRDKILVFAHHLEVSLFLYALLSIRCSISCARLLPTLVFATPVLMVIQIPGYV